MGQVENDIPQHLLARLGFVSDNTCAEPLPHNRILTPGVWRVHGHDGRPAVLKHLAADRLKGSTVWEAHWTERDVEVTRWNYWAREALAYQCGLTNVFAGAGLSGPHCISCQLNDTEALMLLEWVDGTPGAQWPATGYADVAESLGRVQGSPPAVSYPWLSRGFLREYSSEKPVDYSLLDDDEAWAHPTARETFPAGLREQVAFVHANRERLYRISESLPRTLCHLDLWPNNLVRRHSGQPVLFDWAFVGDGAIGEDIGNLVPDACFDHFISAEQLPELERVVFSSYFRGLRASGWDEDPRLVQLGMWSSAVKYDWLAPFTLAELHKDEQVRYGGEGPIDAWFKFRERSRALAFNAGWAERAIELADRLGI